MDGSRVDDGGPVSAPRYRQWRFEPRKTGGTHVSIATYVATAAGEDAVNHATGAKVGQLVMRDEEWEELEEGLLHSGLNLVVRETKRR